MNKQTNKP